MADRELPDISSGLLSDEQVRTLLLMQLHTAEIDGKDGCTEEEMRALVEWAEHVMIDHGMLENVLAGAFRVRWEGDQPSFSLSAKGREEARAAIRRVGGDPDSPSLDDIRRV